MYKFCYNHWDEERFPGFTTSMNSLYNRSVLNYIQNDKPKADNIDETLKIGELCNYLEYYYSILLKQGFVGKNNFSNVIEQLKKIRLIKIMNQNLRDRFNGLTIDEIMIMNPAPGCFRGLSQKESLQLATFHELGHIITSSNKQEIEYLLDVVEKNENSSANKIPKSRSNIKKGLELLDEVAVHNAAESVLYEKKNQERPQVSSYCNSTLYPNGVFLSNFLEYQEFEELAYTFACCLDFISHSKNDSMCDVLKKLSKAMFSRDFCKKMYLELTRNPSKGEDLIIMLICMGKIKEAKYASFGFESENNAEKNVSKYFQKFYSIASQYIEEEDSKTRQKIQV